jgi:hypothetical protein
MLYIFRTPSYATDASRRYWTFEKAIDLKRKEVAL